MTFGDLLRQLRKRSGMTQADLAAAVGYSVPYISNLELDQRQPDIYVVAQRFVPALGLQEEEHLAQRLVELAAAARGERLPQGAMPDSERGRLPQKQPAHSASLPLPPTGLLGRAQEIKSICNRLAGHQGRLMTLLGPPGIGKTRLALAVAEKSQLLYREGVYFVPLAAIGDAELVASTLVAELGIGAANERAPKARLIDFLRRKQCLLLLDNFEQITAAASLVAELLAACPEVSVLVTSRERLRLRAEQCYRVPPLDVESALALFVQRAQAVAAGFELTPDNHAILTSICRQLDCLPLAIELSAARVDLFTPQALLARLRDRRLEVLDDGPRDLPLHQRTLRYAIQRSYDLLDEHEQRLFRTLGVFAGGFEAEHLAEMGGDELTLRSLINKSLVQVIERDEGQRRFLLLETLREFAWEQLCAREEATAIQRAHAELYLRLAEEAAKHLRGPDQALWLERLEVEHANMRAALASSLAAQQIDSAVRLGIALWRFWSHRGYYEEGDRWLEQLLCQADHPQQQAQLLYGRGMLARRRGDTSLAEESLAASLALFRALDDRRGRASALRGLGFVYYLRHDFAGARTLLDEALALFHQLDDLEGVAVTLDNLAYANSDPDEGRRLYEKSLALRRRSGNLRGITMSLAGLATCAIQQADYVAARPYIQEHLRLNQELGNQSGIALSFYLLGRVALGEGDYSTAGVDFEKALKLCRESSDQLLLPSVLQYIGRIMVVSGNFDGGAVLLEEALLLSQEQGASYAAAEVLILLAELAVRQGRAERALCLIGAALANCASLLDREEPVRQAELKRMQSVAREMLSLQAAADAWRAGEAMTIEQAVTYALARPPA
jgi:predicted ATPase/transcriptional regulator with XRE-family HTH domain